MSRGGRLGRALAGALALLASGAQALDAGAPAAPASAASAASAGSSASSGPALRVGDWSLSAPSLALLQRVARLRDPKADALAVAAAATEDHVLGAYARRTVGDAPLFDNLRVAASPEAMAAATLDATITAAFRAPLAAWVGADGGARFVLARHPLSRERLRALLGVDGRLRLDDRLDAAREAALREVVLIDYRIDDATTGSITLQEVWRTLTLQERNLLYRGEAAFAMNRAEARVQSRAVRRWAVTSAATGLAEPDLPVLEALMADHDRRAALARWVGAVADDGFRSAEYERLKTTVTPEDVARYYAGHLEDFVRVERVRARHVQCEDERSAQAASAALAQGGAFDEVARRWSRAVDRVQGGELGWIDATRAQSDWLAQLAFALKPGQPTEPIHAPPVPGHEDRWQIVQVEERVTGHHPADSETVRWLATNAVARERAVQGHAALRAAQLAAVTVEVDAARAGFDADALRARLAR